MDRKIVFLTGKGGVGKTTVSTLVSLYLSSRQKVGVFSFDPAHNLADVLGRDVINNKKKLQNLVAKEVDFEHWKREYLKQIKQGFKSSYSYLTAYNMLDYFDIFEQAPDADNLGMVLAFDDIIRNTDLDFYIFDMPPTAVALDFFRTIRRNMRWVEALINLRKKIIEKKEIISRIKLGVREIETDKVMKRLENLQKFYSYLQNILNSSVYLIVRNTDQLSHLEADRIRTELEKMNFDLVYFVNNKYPEPKDELTLGMINTDAVVDSFPEILAENKDFFQHVEHILSK